MSDQWRQKRVHHGTRDAPRRFRDFTLAIVGPSGIGKTAVLKMVDDLSVFSPVQIAFRS